MPQHTTRSGFVVHTVDLSFQGVSMTIAVYAIPHEGGVVLVESGPGSTLDAVEAGLERLGYRLDDVTHVLLTHIHLDHAGAAGHFARQGAHVYVHHVGAPHMINPERLLTSARRLYGDAMDRLWGEFLPVPTDRLTALHDGDEIVVGPLRFLALDTPGHANHHVAFLLEDFCFLGDIGGVRLPGTRVIRLPTPPPEFHLERWRQSVDRLHRTFAEHAVTHVAPTHFGVFDDPEQHLQAVREALDDLEQWLETTMAASPTQEELRHQLHEHLKAYLLSRGFPPELWAEHEAVMPIAMSADGLWRYWHKYRASGKT